MESSANGTQRETPNYADGKTGWVGDEKKGKGGGSKRAKSILTIPFFKSKIIKDYLLLLKIFCIVFN